MKFEIICRVCLEKGKLKSLFTTKCLSNMSCAEAILNIFSVSIYENDGLPNNICHKCLIKLKATYKFRMLCEKSQMKLTEYISILKNSPIEIKSENLDESEIETNIGKTSLQKDQIIHKSSMIKNEILNQDENNSDFSVKDYKIEYSKKDYLVQNRTLEKIQNEKNENFHQFLKDNPNNIKYESLDTPLNENKNKNAPEENKSILKVKSRKQFQCEFCAKVFLRAATLRTHLLAHKNELPFRCSHPGCNKGFPLSSRLKLHMKVHTDERNFICQYCSHAARDKQQLIVHIRYLHTKEKNFLCGTCGKRFVSAQARYYHTKRHENIRNHHCPHCDRSFIFACGLREHLVTHTGEKRFACSLCDTRFSRKAHKIQHEVRIHGINEPSVKRKKT